MTALVVLAAVIGVAAVLRLRLVAARASGPGGRHRIADAHTGSLSATALLRALNGEVGEG